MLYRDVTLFVADQLISTLREFHHVDADIRRDLNVLRRTLVKQRAAGTPWLARAAADVLAMLDTTVWTSVLGLLDECPILPAALTAVLERRIHRSARSTSTSFRRGHRSATFGCSCARFQTGCLRDAQRSSAATLSWPRLTAHASGVAHSGSSGRLFAAPWSSRNVTISS